MAYQASENETIELPNGIEIEYEGKQFDDDVEGIFIDSGSRSRFWTTEELEILSKSNDLEEAYLRMYRSSEIELEN